MICRVKGCPQEIASGSGITICLPHERQFDREFSAQWAEMNLAARRAAWQRFLAEAEDTPEVLGQSEDALEFGELGRELRARMFEMEEERESSPQGREE